MTLLAHSTHKILGYQAEEVFVVEGHSPSSSRSNEKANPGTPSLDGGVPGFSRGPFFKGIKS